MSSTARLMTNSHINVRNRAQEPRRCTLLTFTLNGVMGGMSSLHDSHTIGWPEEERPLCAEVPVPKGIQEDSPFVYPIVFPFSSGRAE